MVRRITQLKVHLALKPKVWDLVCVAYKITGDNGTIAIRFLKEIFKLCTDYTFFL